MSIPVENDFILLYKVVGRRMLITLVGASLGKVKSRSFKDKETENLFNRVRTRNLPSNLLRVGLRKLRMLNRAVTLNDLRVPPANRLEKLKGNRKGQHSIRINDQFRICFEWHNDDSFKVEIVDYHKG